MDKSKYEIHWVITNRETLQSETHELTLVDEEMYWDQIKFLVKTHTKRNATVNVAFDKSSAYTCTLTVWS